MKTEGSSSLQIVIRTNTLPCKIVRLGLVKIYCRSTIDSFVEPSIETHNPL